MSYKMETFHRKRLPLVTVPLCESNFRKGIFYLSVLNVSLYYATVAGHHVTCYRRFVHSLHFMGEEKQSSQSVALLCKLFCGSQVWIIKPHCTYGGVVTDSRFCKFSDVQKLSGSSGFHMVESKERSSFPLRCPCRKNNSPQEEQMIRSVEGQLWTTDTYRFLEGRSVDSASRTRVWLCKDIQTQRTSGRGQRIGAGAGKWQLTSRDFLGSLSSCLPQACTEQTPKGSCLPKLKARLEKMNKEAEFWCPGVECILLLPFRSSVIWNQPWKAPPTNPCKSTMLVWTGYWMAFMFTGGK